jgi:predicted nuclease of predicted toxin-antitoxin system
VVDGLKRRGIDVLTTVDAEMRGASDERQLAFASAQQRVLVTKDDDLLKLHAEGVQHAGIVFVPAQATISAVVQGLVLVYGVLDSEEMENHIEFL